ncbi:MAG: site-specific DNA-methyltransferase [Anaerolineae bacterium]|nr:site-specific DNA-methyltransferase [Anaerolineae bacterium]
MRVTDKIVTQPTLIFSEVSANSTVYLGDAHRVLANLPSQICQTAITSPPYWGLRDYALPGQIGSEEEVDDYVNNLVSVFRELGRVLRDDGTFWLNLGDCYTSGGRTWRAPDKKNPARAMSYRPPTPEGLKPKDLVGVPWRVAMALQADGWYLRSEIIWHKPNPLPESVKDRPTSAHETIFLLSKNAKYFYDYEAIKERGVNGKRRNKRSVWTVQSEPINEAHFATFPTKLIEPCILAGSKEGDFVIDPFFGSGTTGLVAALHGRNFIGVELKPEYIEIARKRLREYGFTFNVIGSDQNGEWHA